MVTEPAPDPRRLSIPGIVPGNPRLTPPDRLQDAESTSNSVGGRGGDRRRRPRHLVHGAPGYRPDRSARAFRIRSGPGRGRRHAGGDRRLRRLPHATRRAAIRRWSRSGDSLRRDPFHQHHPGSGHRHRALARGRLRPRHASGHRPGRQPSVPRFPLRPLLVGNGWRSAGALRFPDDPRPGRRNGPGERAQIPVQHPPAAGGLEFALSGGRPLRAGPVERRGMEPGRLFGGWPRPLRRLP